ncbi:hypothetical protein AYI70_g3817 [Smittium culicis]|uniref:Uncharacterized protein n=1 Tax=Smittium culicis TaxID=133412 RepID=A0A1R1Y226_9FUNG|nr:hypothetical protein AYI70_g3817 [Smittium culicis]
MFLVPIQLILSHLSLELPPETRRYGSEEVLVFPYPLSSGCELRGGSKYEDPATSDIHRIDDARFQTEKKELNLVIVAPKEKRGGQTVEKPCLITIHRN